MPFHLETAPSFTRPNNTTQYSSGQLVANSTTASAVTPLIFTDDQRVVAGSGLIRRAPMWKSSTGTTNASFRLHLYALNVALANPTGIVNGDGGNWLTDRNAYIGSLDVTMAKAFNDAAFGVATPTDGYDLTFHLSGNTIWGLIEARAAYTPVALETFAATLEIIQPGMRD